MQAASLEILQFNRYRGHCDAESLSLMICLDISSVPAILSSLHHSDAVLPSLLLVLPPESGGANLLLGDDFRVYQAVRKSTSGNSRDLENNFSTVKGRISRSRHHTYFEKMNTIYMMLHPAKISGYRYSVCTINSCAHTTFQCVGVPLLCHPQENSNCLRKPSCEKFDQTGNALRCVAGQEVCDCRMV